MDAELTVGQVAQATGVTVRTLHHYDEIGLLEPSARSRAGYRLYTGADLERLAVVVAYRRLGMPLPAIAGALADESTLIDHLQRQRDCVANQLDTLTDLAHAIDTTLERLMTGTPATPDDLAEIFGEGYSEEHQAEARERWGESAAFAQSAARTSRYTKTDWEKIKTEGDAATQAFVRAMDSGRPPSSAEAMAAAEAHRRHIETWFYDLDHDVHRGLADMYVADPRFTTTYEDIAPGLAAYVREAIHANADRQPTR